MNIIKNSMDLILHLDKYFNFVMQAYGIWTYLILLFVIFCETGLVVTPFLPGDSLLFAAGAFASTGSLDIKYLFPIFGMAAALGDTVNYFIGKSIGFKIFEKENLRFIKKEHLIKTHKFYEKHGGKTIIIARFIPVIRTFAPFVAGIGEMSCMRFISYNIIGGILWVALFLFGGFFFGNLSFVKSNFTFILIAIIIISILPGVIGIIWGKKQSISNI